MSAQQPKQVENVRRTNAKLFCKQCLKDKDESEFYKFSGKYRKEYACKKCVNIRRRKHYQKNKVRIIAVAKKYREKNRERVLHAKRKQTYGITKEQYNKMLEQQNFVCAVCKNPESSRVGKGNCADYKNSLSVDHNHKTGKIRGLLCSKCNRALGYLQESVEIMQSLISYIKKY